MSDKVIKFPITHSQKRKNQLGPLAIKCEVSGRLVKFNPKSDFVRNDSEFIYLEIFPDSDPDFPDKEQKRICELVLTREDLMKALEHISPS